MKDSFGFGSFSLRKKEKTGYMIVAALIGCIFILGPCIYRATGDEVTITVSERERVHNRSGEGARYLVWTEEGEVFQVSDSISYLTFRASDRYGKLIDGSGSEHPVHYP